MKWCVIRSTEKIETNPTNINMVWNPVWGFPGSTVVRIPHFHCWGLNLTPGSGTNYYATWCEKTTHWKRPWFWERLKVGGEGDDRGWDGDRGCVNDSHAHVHLFWGNLFCFIDLFDIMDTMDMSLTQWTWVWVSSGSWWWPGKPGMLQSMGSQRVGHDWATELTERN